MSNDKILILVTGLPGSGKSELMFKLVQKLKRTHRLGGFATRGIGRDRPDLFGAAERYELFPVGETNASGRLWADRDGETCVFRDETRQWAQEMVLTQCAQAPLSRPEVMFIDEIGRLELSEKGFATLLNSALSSDVPVVVIALKKKALAEIVAHFHLEKGRIFDLSDGKTTHKRALRDILRLISSLDSERIGAFAGLQGLVEVGLGSTLRALKIPLKGHFLAYLQNALLISFGKSLRGRGLFRISFISAMLKAFSPMGGTIRPMLYILLQGGIFALPAAFFGFNLITVILGSVLMAWLTLTVKLFLDYLVFGMAFFDAYAGAIRKVSQWADIQGLSLTSVICLAFALKTVLAVALAIAAYKGDMRPLIQRLRVRPKWAPAPRMDAVNPSAKSSDSEATQEANTPQKSASVPKKKSLKKAATGALRDLVNWRFALFFFVSVLLMLFFADLSGSDLVAIVIRGLCISYVGFLALRSVDFYRLGVRLDGRLNLGLERSLPKAMEALATGFAEDVTSGSISQESSSSGASSSPFTSKDGSDSSGR